MAAEYKTLGQVLASGSGIETYTTLYEVPAATSAVVSNLHICNLTSSEQTVRIAVAAATTPTNEEFIAYNLKVDGNEAYPLVVGITMRNSGANPTRYLVVSASSGSVAFGAFGAEQ